MISHSTDWDGLRQDASRSTGEAGAARVTASLLTVLSCAISLGHSQGVRLSSQALFYVVAVRQGTAQPALQS